MRRDAKARRRAIAVLTSGAATAAALVLLQLMRRDASVVTTVRPSLETAVEVLPAGVRRDRAGVDAPSGPVQDTVQALGTDMWLLRFTGLRSVRVAIESPVPHSLSCRILDSGNNPVLTSETRNAGCILAWTPLRTGAYQIEIRNQGMVPAPYVLTSTH